MTFADPLHCPDCGAPLPVASRRCPQCALPLDVPLAADLFQTLTSADRLLAELRRVRDEALVPAGAGPAGVPSSVEGDRVTSRPAATAPLIPGPVRAGIRGASVPQILLGLGAVCLLVAALTFLVVAWSWLGVGGRTAVLVGFTATAAALSRWLGRRGLRTAAEALGAVGFGLLTLDVFGAADAGWLGDLSPTWVAGAVIAAAAVAVVSLNRPRRRPTDDERSIDGPSTAQPSTDAPSIATSASPLVIPQVAAAVGAMMFWADRIDGDLARDHFSIGATLAALTFAGLGVLGARWWVKTWPWLAVAGGALWTVALVLDALGTIDENPTLRALWLEGHGVPLLVAGGLAMAPSAIFRSPWVRLAGAGVAGILISVAVLIPAFDESPTTLGASAAAFLLVGALVIALAPRPWHIAAAPTTAVPLLIATVLAAFQVAAALERLLFADPFTTTATRSLGPVAATTDHAQPWLLPVLVAAAVLTVMCLARISDPRRREPADLLREFWPACVSLVLVAAALGLALYDVPLALVVGCLMMIALAGVAATRFLPDSGRLPSWSARATLASASGAAALAVVVALPSDLLTGLALAPVIAVAALAALGDHSPSTRTPSTRTPSTRTGGEALLPPAIAGFLVAASSVVDLAGQWWAVPVLLALGGLAIARPRIVLEASAAVAGLLAGAGSALADQATLSTVAVSLTVAGALVTGSSLVHPSRRILAWPGGLLLAMATWARLLDLGVEEPEAYTLPSAIALLAVGLWRLHRDPHASTRFALAPGLLLASVPSLLWTLVDPFGWRGVLLGLGCLVMVGSGVALRWSAPLLVGAGVGLVLTLRASEPIITATPSWVLIGLAGTLLTVVGVTWESRMRDLRTATAYLARLR